MTNTHNIKKVIDSIESSLKHHPENEELLLKLAEAYFQLGVFDQKRVELYETVSEIYSDASHIHQALSIGYLIQQVQFLINEINDLDNIDQITIDKNIAKLQELSQNYPLSIEIPKALGDVNLLRGNISESIIAYDESIKRGFEETGEILKVFELAYYHHNFNPEDLIYFGDLYSKAGNSDKAIDIFRSIIKNGFLDSIVAGKLIKLINERIKTTDSLTMLNNYYIELAEVFINLGEINEALMLAQKIDIGRLQDYSFIKQLARRLLMMEDYRQAFDYLSRIPLDEEAKNLINEISIHLEKKGELDTAVYLLKFMNENDIMAAEAKVDEEKELAINTELGLADLNYRNKRYELAVEKYINALSLGYQEYDSIVPKIDRIIKKLEKTPIESLIRLGKLFSEIGQHYRAMNYFGMVIENYPDNTEGIQELRQICDKLLKQNPELAELRIKSGDLYIIEGNLNKAIEEYSYAANFPEVNLRANKKLAHTFLKSGNLMMTFEKYKYNPILEEEDYNILYELMQKFEEAKNLNEAAEVAKIIIDSDPDFKDIREQHERLQKTLKEATPSIFIDQKMVELIGEQSIGRYKYIEKIGSGGMGVVYKVLDVKTDSIIAMKVLRSGFSSSSKAIDRFFREARIAATLNHRNIVNIYDYTISNSIGQSYIAMEYVDGPSLRDIVEERFKDGVNTNIEQIRETLYYLSQLCDALAATHRKGIIHRDIKPDNIMINSKKLVKITDFGIVHIEEATFTPTGALIGTPRYMSPEQVQGGKIDGRSDLYSVGIIAYEMMVGTPPFISGDIAYQQVNLEPTPPREICPIIPVEINDLIVKTLQKDPRDRFNKAMDLKKEVDIQLKMLGGYQPDKNTTLDEPEPEPLLDPDLDI